jgi:hypothetical protein
VNATAPASGRVAVTVVAGHRQADLALPGVVPVADLLPSLVGSAGLLDPASAVAGHQLTTYDGRVLAADRGLVDQGVTAGAILVLQAASDVLPPPRWDDLVEAVADVRGGHRSWGDVTADGLTTALARALVAAVLLLGALALVSDHASSLAPVLAAVIAVALLVCAAAFSRLLQDAGLAVLAAVAASGYAAVAGLMVAGGGPVLGTPAAVGGGAGIGAAAVACAVLTDHRILLLPTASTSVVLLAVGSAAPVVDPAAALTVAAVGAAAASLSFPTLAVAATATGRLAARGRHAAVTDGVDAALVAHDVRLAHRLVAAWTASAGALLLVVAPLATSAGAGAAVSVALAALVLALEPAARRGAAAALVGGVSGALGLILVACSALWLHPGSRVVVAPALAASGLLVLADVSLRRAATSAARTRIREVVEATALVGLAPAVVLAVGSSSGLRLALP